MLANCVLHVEDYVDQCLPNSLVVRGQHNRFDFIQLLPNITRGTQVCNHFANLAINRVEGINVAVVNALFHLLFECVSMLDKLFKNTSVFLVVFVNRWRKHYVFLDSRHGLCFFLLCLNYRRKP
ncbi:hypothetical protein D3C86_1862840 [compost metagenome]